MNQISKRRPSSSRVIRPSQEPPLEIEATNSNNMTWILNNPVWIMVAVIALIVLVCWYSSPPSRDLPPDLVGVWRSSEPAYADRFFEIDKVAVGFGTGEGTVSVGFVKEVKISIEGGRTLYTISYLQDGTPSEVSFYQDATEANVIRFRNQEKIAWRREGIHAQSNQ